MDGFFSNSRYVKLLSPGDFDPVATWKLKTKEPSMVLFFVNWCGYCKAVKDEWEKLGKQTGYCNVYAFDCDKHKGHTDKIKTDRPGLIQGYPTIVMYCNGEPKETHSGERTVASFTQTCMRCSSGKKV